ncbi:MAG: glycosyltransferase family 2 protein [Candidatus Sericytochromatia bacterium]|nr:glycosyltransferase family 2 protein [Candidatus Sericytochromatia bacterium]
MDVSIIVISYNTKDYTKKCLESIYQKTKDIDFDIYVVDNKSSDGSQEMIKSNFPQIKLIENNHNVGFGSANNQAIKLSIARYVFLLNPDTFLLNNAIKILYDFIDNKGNKGVGCCGGDIFDQDMLPIISHGHFPTLRHIIFEFGLNKIFKSYFINNISDGVANYGYKIKNVQYISGSAMLIRREALDKVGLFDEDFFLYYEETELCYRIFKLGYRIMLVPQAKIIHYMSKSVEKINNEKKIRFQTTGKYLFFKKSYGTLQAKIAVLLLIIKYSLLTILLRKKDYFIRLKINIQLFF